MPQKIIHTQEELDWIAEHYLILQRKEICAKFGFSQSHLSKVAHQLGIRKPRGQFKKGENNMQRIGYEREMARRQKVSAIMKELWRVERARATFGVPRKTKFKVNKQPLKKVNQRYYLKRHGYLIDETNLIAYWTPETHRCMTLERKPRTFYKFAEYYDE